MAQTKSRHKPSYKKFLRLKVNPINNNKFLKLKVELNRQFKVTQIKNRTVKKLVETKRFTEIGKFNKKKWITFLNLQKKANKFYKKFKPYTIYCYNTSKFAGQGNSFKKKFRNDLLAKKIFNYMYGGLLKKYLKNRMTSIYRSQRVQNPIRICIEFFESRLDSVIYKSKFGHSLKNARQLITHKHIKVNNKIEKNKSYILKQGDLITVDLKAIAIVKKNLNKQFKERPDSIIWPMPPSYLNINYHTLEIIFGNIKNFNFATSFTFKIDTNSVITNYYRH